MFLFSLYVEDDPDPHQAAFGSSTKVGGKRADSELSPSIIGFLTLPADGL